MSRRYVGLFCGTTVQTAKMVAAISDPEIVRSVAWAALQKIRQPEDPVLACIEAGNKSALEAVLREKEVPPKDKH